MSVVNYQKLTLDACHKCGTPILFDGKAWLHKDKDEPCPHDPQPSINAAQTEVPEAFQWQMEDGAKGWIDLGEAIGRNRVSIIAGPMTRFSSTFNPFWFTYVEIFDDIGNIKTWVLSKAVLKHYPVYPEEQIAEIRKLLDSSCKPGRLEASLKQILETSDWAIPKEDL